MTDNRDDASRENEKPGGKRTARQGAAKKRSHPNGSRDMPEAKYLEDFDPEFVVLAKPLAIVSKPDGRMEIVNSIEGVIAITLHTGRHPENSPLTFRIPNEIERYARLTIVERRYCVELGTHLTRQNVVKRPARRKKGAEASEPVPLQGIDAATITFLWLNRGELPKWADLQDVERLP